MNHTPDTLLIVDQDQRFHQAQSRGKVLDVHQEAWLLSQYMKVLGDHPRKLAVISSHDPEGIKAYRQQGYEILAVNGTRPEELQNMLQSECRWVAQNPLETLVLVTSDPSFATLSSWAARTQNTEVIIWADTDHLPAELEQTSSQTRNLNSLLPIERRVAVFIDYENLYIGLQRAGYPLEPRAIIQAIRDALRGKGEVSQISAFADWDKLRHTPSTNLQRELVRQGVETHYLISQNGKNSADIRMVTEALKQIDILHQNKGQASDIALVTGDRDFCDLVKTAQEMGSEVYVLSLRSCLSAALEASATQVYYLEDHLEKPACEVNDPELLSSSYKYAILVMKIQNWLRQNKYQWAFKNEMIAALHLGPIQIAQLQNAIETGIFSQSQRWSQNTNQVEATIQINLNHPLSRAVDAFSDWAVNRVTFCLLEKGMPYVDTNYLARGMLKDSSLQQMNIGQTAEDALWWLETASAAGLLVKRSQPHPRKSSVIILQWFLPNP